MRWCCVEFLAIQAKLRTAREQQLTSSGRVESRFLYADVALGCLSRALAARLACSFSSSSYFGSRPLSTAFDRLASRSDGLIW